MTQPNILQHEDSPMKSRSSFNRYMNGDDEEYDGYELHLPPYTGMRADMSCKTEKILVDRCKSDRQLLFDFIKGYERLMLANHRSQCELYDEMSKGFEMKKMWEREREKYEYLKKFSRGKCDDMDKTMGDGITLMEKMDKTCKQRDERIIKITRALNKLGEMVCNHIGDEDYEKLQEEFFTVYDVLL